MLKTIIVGIEIVGFIIWVLFLWFSGAIGLENNKFRYYKNGCLYRIIGMIILGIIIGTITLLKKIE